MSRGFKSIGEVFNNEEFFRKTRVFIRETEASEIFFCLFPDLKTVISKVEVKNGILLLRADNSVLKSELHFMEKQIIAKMNEKTGENFIKEIKFLK